MEFVNNDFKIDKSENRKIIVLCCNNIYYQIG